MIDPDAEYWLWVCMALAYYVGVWFLDTSPAPWWVWLGGGWIAFPPPKLQYPVTDGGTTTCRVPNGQEHREAPRESAASGLEAQQKASRREAGPED